MLSAVGAHLRSHACSLTLVVQLCLSMKHVIARQARFNAMQPCSTWYYITLQSFQVSLRPRNASHTGKVAEVPMLNVRCGTEHACTGEILSRKESRRHESCPRPHHRPRSVFCGARELQFCPCSAVSPSPASTEARPDGAVNACWVSTMTRDNGKRVAKALRYIARPGERRGHDGDALFTRGSRKC